MEIKVIGNQLSQYGSSTFYKGLIFKIPTSVKAESVDNKNAIKTNDGFFENEEKHHAESGDQKTLVIGMGDCVPVRPFQSDSLIECLAEVRMIWRDKIEQTLLLSLRLYYLPENTPKGRIGGHGEDEVFAVKDAESPKGRIIIRAEDFSSWLVEDLKWNWGLMTNSYEKSSSTIVSSNGIPASSLLSNTKLDLSEVEKEKDGKLHSNVTVLSYSRYCRYRAVLKRLEHIEDSTLRNKMIETLSGYVTSQPNTRIMFAKETFEYPDLESHPDLCPHLAPKLKGKPLKGRRKKISNRISDCSSPTPSSEYSVDSCETNDSDVFDGKIKNDHLKNSQRLTRNKRKSESVQPEVYTTLSTGRISKQRLPLTPLKSTLTNKRKRKTDVSEESSSDDEDQQDEDYDEPGKRLNRKLKQESGAKRQNYVKEESDYGTQLLQALQMPLDTSKSPEELDFLIRLNTFMAERASTYPKLVWELRDVNLFTIYMRVQKLGGFNAIADNRVWKNLFEDLSEPGGKCITQGMTKRRYERILLPFERFERDLRENGKQSRSELTISTIPKNSVRSLQQTQGKRRSSSSPSIEIIPLKNGAPKNVELSVEQMDYNSSNDGVSVPVHVIVRPSTNGVFDTTKRRAFESDNKMPGSSRSFVGGQKENIPLMLQSSTTIVPLTRDGVPANIVELIDSDDEGDCKRTLGGQNMKKRKLDILREGGLEVTPISRRTQAESLLMTYPPTSRQATMQPNVSLMSLTAVRAPPVIQSLNMYQSTSQVFKNPKEDVFNAAKNSKSYCLDLTSKKQQQDYQQNHQRSKNNQLSIEEVQRNYRGSNPDLQITLVKPHMESPTSSSSNTNSSSQKNRQVPYKKSKNVPSSSAASHTVPPLNPVIVAAANELQKLQQQNMPSLFPFLSGLDITPPLHRQEQSAPKNNQPAFDQSQASLMSYLTALYANPLLHGQNILPNIPAVEFLKMYNNSSSSNNRIPSSKN